MPVVVLFIVLAVIVFLLAKSLQDAKRQQGGGTVPNPLRVPNPAATKPPRQRARRRQPALDEETLAAHVSKLKEAVTTGLVSVDDAVDSIVRQTDGVIGPDAARKLLQHDDAA